MPLPRARRPFHRGGPARSRSPRPRKTPWAFTDRDTVNADTVTIITAPAGGAKSVFAVDMARVLDEKDKQLALPVLGKGPVRNVIDLLIRAIPGMESPRQKLKMQTPRQGANFELLVTVGVDAVQ